MSKVIVVGGGAAGMLAAISAASIGHNVSILEKNEKLGKKLYITGKGRCNLTNASDMKTVMEHVVSNPRFLFSAFKSYTNEDVMRLMEEAGTPLKIERGNRVFPISNKSSDILAAFGRILKNYEVSIYLNTGVERILVEDGKCIGVTAGGKTYQADAVIVATGGISYPATGSTGDGYRFAKESGHTVSKLSPSLVPFNVLEERVKSLQGLSLRNVTATIYHGDKKVYEEFGEMIFTHFGVSGPILISASAYVGELLKQDMLKLFVDLKPALDEKTLKERYIREFEKSRTKILKNVLGELFPSKLIDEVIFQSGIAHTKLVGEITKEERNRLIQVTKGLRFTLSSLRGYNEAIITRGGVEVSQIHPKTMESKLVKGLYFAGEVLDLDALTGGYNLQIAWSTGFCAGGSIEYV